jgi:hypothetical protein
MSASIKSYRAVVFGILSIAILSLPTVAWGGLISGDTYAIDGWHGTLQWTGTTNPAYPPLKSLYANIDYAVYAPGDFAKTFTGWTDPSDGDQYVYAYQLFNDAHTPASDDAAIRTFSMGIHSGEQIADVYYGTIDDAGTTLDKTPTSWVWSGTPTATSIIGSFNTSSNRITVGTRSVILYFTSEYGPTWDHTNMIGYPYACTDQANQFYLPAPVPEPGTLAILAIAGIAYFFSRRWRSRVSP